MTPVTAQVVLAVDVGGTKLAVGLVDGSGRVLASRRVTTPATAPERALTELIDDLLRSFDNLDSDVREIPISGVGIGCGGPMSWPAGRVSPVNIAAWRDFPLRAMLAERFPGLPVRLLNDAICLGIAEHWQGAGRGVPDLLGMVVSTGVGGGLVLGNRVVVGRTGNAGHIGHVVVEPEGPACGCGGRGCLEAIARGPALVAWAREQGWTGADGRDLAVSAHAGDEVALAAFARAGRAIAIAVAGAATTLDLSFVVIGGGIAGAGDVLFGPLREELQARARLDFVRELRVVPAALGEQAGLIGAAALVLAGDRYWPADAVPASGSAH
jgi:glucokinase